MSQPLHHRVITSYLLASQFEIHTPTVKDLPAILKQGECDFIMDWHVE